MTIVQGTNFEVSVNTFALALDTTSGYNKLSGTIDLSYVYVGSGSLPSVVSLRYGFRTATEEIVEAIALPEIDTAFDFAATVPQTVVGIGEFALFAYLSCNYTDDAQVTSDTVTTSDVPVADPFGLDYVYRLQKAAELTWAEGDDNTRINDLREKWLKTQLLTKLAKALPSGKIFIGNAEGEAVPGDMPDLNSVDGDIKLINQHAIYFLQTPGATTDGDVRIAPTGKFEEYNAASGTWLAIGSGAGLSTYKGYWDANTNTPTILSGDGTAGDWYLVDVAGTTEIDGLTPWGVGDVIWYDGDTGHWQMINNQTAAPTKPVGATGAVQFKGAGGNFDWTTDLLFESTNRALALQRLRLYIGLSVVPIAGAVERDATDLYFTASDLVRRKVPVRLTTNKTFIGSATNEPSEIGTTDIYGASTTTKTFLDTEANWYDGSGNPKASVFPGSGEVGQRHRNTNYIYECVAVGEWVRYILPKGYVDVWGLPLSEKIKLENAANWTGKVYTGTALSGCLAGYKHFTNDYVFEFVALNTPIRYART